MAAKKRNHTIPVLLLKGFASRIDDEKHFVWMLERGKSPREVSVRDAGLGHAFYGGAATGIEDALSEVETTHGPTIRKIREGAEANQFAPQLEHLVRILTARTAAARIHLTGFMRVLLGVAAQVFRSNEAQAALRATIDPAIERVLENILAGLPPERRRVIESAMRMRPDIKAALFGLGRAHAESIIPIAIDRINLAIGLIDPTHLGRNGQLQALTRMVVEERPLPSLGAAAWHALRAAPNSFVLGDCCAFAVLPTGETTLMLGSADDWREVYCPIAHDTVIVATRSPQAPSLSTDAINQASAACSHRFLFSSLRFPPPDLASMIGEQETAIRGGWIAQATVGMLEALRERASGKAAQG